jgi:hypothetical protein
MPQVHTPGRHTRCDCGAAAHAVAAQHCPHSLPVCQLATLLRHHSALYTLSSITHSLGSSKPPPHMPSSRHETCSARLAGRPHVLPHTQVYASVVKHQSPHAACIAGISDAAKHHVLRPPCSTSRCAGRMCATSSHTIPPHCSSIQQACKFHNIWRRGHTRSAPRKTIRCCVPHCFIRTDNACMYQKQCRAVSALASPPILSWLCHAVPPFSRLLLCATVPQHR